jgi:antagonist of KipI
MGFNLSGPKLSLTIPNNFLSSGVTRGTLQLLPSGDIIVLMADHQTIGGYANLGQIILVDLPRFAQLKNGQSFHFALTDLDNANQLYRNIYEKFQH